MKQERKKGDEPMRASGELERFLTFLRTAESLLGQAEAGQQEAEAQTQDILHALELERHSYHEVAALGRELSRVRQERRRHKDAAAQLAPVVEWARANEGTVHSLQRLLGEVRKAERSVQNRIYTPKTDILRREE